MRTGLFAIASFDERPVDRADAARLGITEMPDTHFGCNWVDNRLVARPYHRDSCITYLLGELNDRDGAAQRLNLPPNASLSEIGSHALDRWHDRISGELPGYWSLLRWDKREQRIWIVTSHIMPDPILIARCGGKIALAPDVRTLCMLPWVEREIDEDGVALAALPWKERRDHPNPSVFRNVSALQSGALHRIDALGMVSSERPQQPLSSFAGSFQEGSAQLEQIARNSMRRILERHDTVAVSLSGGLDSSLIALLAAQEACPGQRIFAVSSVALPGTDVEDEQHYIDVVAQSLGIEVVYVTPPDDLEFLCPHQSVLDAKINPSIAPNHHVYRHLLNAADEAGASACIGGEYGEAHFSRLPIAQPKRLRQSSRRLVRGLWPSKPSQPTRLFWPSPEIEERARGLAREPEPPAPSGHAGLFGYREVFEKTGRTAIRSQHHRVGYYQFFETAELFRLASGFPDHFANQNGRTRALARDVLKRHLPREIWDRAEKKPISPDFSYRMGKALPQISQLVETYAAREVDRWIDLDRLLDAIRLASGRQGTLPAMQAREIQLTFGAATYFSRLQEQV